MSNVRDIILWIWNGRVVLAVYIQQQLILRDNPRTHYEDMENEIFEVEFAICELPVGDVSVHRRKILSFVNKWNHFTASID